MLSVGQQPTKVLSNSSLLVQEGLSFCIEGIISFLFHTHGRTTKAYCTTFTGALHNCRSTHEYLDSLLL